MEIKYKTILKIDQIESGYLVTAQDSKSTASVTKAYHEVGVDGGETPKMIGDILKLLGLKDSYELKRK